MSRMRSLILLMTLMLTQIAWAGPGLDPVEALPDAAQEARARALFKELRCVVCQSESLDDSEADLARDMRRLVRDLVAQGKSDSGIKDHLTARYGDFVLLNTPVRPSTWTLWFGPFLALMAILALVSVYVYRRRPAIEPPLAEDEVKTLNRLRDRQG